MGILANIGTSIAGAALGIGSDAISSGRQVKQQKEIMDAQKQNEKELASYKNGLAIDTWNKTNYEATVGHLKAAGLNPGLVYGMGGAGGTTTGNQAGGATGGSVSAQNSGTAGMGMAIQLGLMQAQKENIEADTKLKEADATKTAGVDTQEAGTRIQSLLQGITNEKSKNAMIQVETRLKEIEEQESNTSRQDRMDLIEYKTKQAIQELDILTADNTIAWNTIADKLTIIRQEAIGAGIENELKKSNITVNKEQINKWKTELSQGWQNLSLTERKLKLEAWEKEIKAEYPSIGEAIGREIMGLSNTIDDRTNKRFYKSPEKNK